MRTSSFRPGMSLHRTNYAMRRETTEDMTKQPKMAALAFLIADPARASMLTALLDGRARWGGELAIAGDTIEQSARAYLRKLVASKLVAETTLRDHKYYRIASDLVVQLLTAFIALG